VSSAVIGRDREIADGHGFLEQVARAPRGLLIAGEPGIGKTTVWSAIVDAAIERGWEALVARPSEAEADLAYGVLTDLFAGVGDEVLAVLPAPQGVAVETALRRTEQRRPVEPAAVALGALEVVRRLARTRPTLVAVDDLQWVDAPSLRVLSYAFRRLEGQTGLIATLRSGFEGELTRLARIDTEGLARIDLESLDERSLARIVFERTGRPLTPHQLHRLVELSGGNPFFALELATTGGHGSALPEGRSATLRARLASLSDEARSVGLTAAVLGRFDESVPGGVAGRGLDELRRTGVVVVRSGVPVFAHPLLASTLLDMHTAAERRAVHRSLAAVVDDPDERALHLGRGSDRRSTAVAQELEDAARRLDARGAPETAATLAERAAALTPQRDQEARTRRLITAADLYQAAGEGGAHVLPLLEQLAESLPAGPARARVLVRLGWLGAQMDVLPASTAVAYQHQALAEGLEAPDVTSAAHAVLARLLGNSGDYRAAHRHSELAVAAGEAAEANLMFPSPLGELGMATFMAGAGLDESCFTEGIDLEARLGRVGEPYQSPRLQLALALLYTGELGRARELLHDLRRRSIELGRVRSTAGCALHLVDLEARAGRLDAAEAHAAEFVDLDLQLRGDLSSEWYPSGLVAVHLGRVDDARRILHAGVDYSARIESTIWLAHQQWALGHLELALGNLEPAREALVPLVPMLRKTGMGDWSVHPVHPDAIEALAGLGELDAAAELCSELEEFARRLDRPWGLATAARSRALLASARGDADGALVAIEHALREHERLEWPLERARTLLAAGRILRRLARRRDARERLEQARAILTSIRSPLWLAQVEAEDGRVGGRRRSGALTPAESRVAALAGQGLRNTEIAARLHLAPKTVESTLSLVYRKLGVRSRTELARRQLEASTTGDGVGADASEATGR
jgi:DNA-binding CsgD family transcriptional regulator